MEKRRERQRGLSSERDFGVPVAWVLRKQGGEKGRSTQAENQTVRVRGKEGTTAYTSIGEIGDPYQKGERAKRGKGER